jgi:hypothetical protein
VLSILPAAAYEVMGGFVPVQLSPRVDSPIWLELRESLAADLNDGNIPIDNSWLFAGARWA